MGAFHGQSFSVVVEARRSQRLLPRIHIIPRCQGPQARHGVLIGYLFAQGLPTVTNRGPSPSS